jgi:hypothetical protein
MEKKLLLLLGLFLFFPILSQGVKAFTYLPKGKYDYNATDLLNYGFSLGSFSDVRNVIVPAGCFAVYGKGYTGSREIPIPKDDRIWYILVTGYTWSYGSNSLYIRNVNLSTETHLITRRYGLYYIGEIKDLIVPPYDYTLKVTLYVDEWTTVNSCISTVQFLDSEMRVIDNQEFNETIYYTAIPIKNDTVDPFATISSFPYVKTYENVSIAPPFKFYPYEWRVITYNATTVGDPMEIAMSTRLGLDGNVLNIYRVDLTYYRPPNITELWFNIYDGTHYMSIELTPTCTNVYDPSVPDAELCVKGNLNFGALSNPAKLIYYRTPTYARLFDLSAPDWKVAEIPVRLTRNFNELHFIANSTTGTNIKYYQTDFQLIGGYIPITNAVLTSNKYQVIQNEIFNLTATWEGGTAPFTLYWYRRKVPEPFSWFATHYNIYERTWSTETTIPYEGTYEFYFIVDDGKTQLQSNTIQINVSYAVPIYPPHTAINEVEGSPYAPPINITVNWTDMLNVRIWNVSGGYPPYTVSLRDTVTNTDIIKCTNVSSGGECVRIFSTSAIPLPFQDCYTVGTLEYCRNYFFTRVLDSEDQVWTSYIHTVIIRKAILGPPLNITLSLTPFVNLTTNTSTILRVNVTGGIQPIRIAIWDTWGTTTLCDWTINVTNVTTSLTVYWYGGDHGVFANAWSWDGQTEVSNWLYFTVNSSWDGILNRLKDWVIGCTGTMAGSATPYENESLWTPYVPPPEVPPEIVIPQPSPEIFQPYVNKSILDQLGIGYTAPLFTPFFFVIIFALGISAFITKKLEPEKPSLVFGISFIAILICLAILNIFPVWIVFILVVLVAFLLAKFVLGLI